MFCVMMTSLPTCRHIRAVLVSEIESDLLLACYSQLFGNIKSNIFFM